MNGIIKTATYCHVIMIYRKHYFIGAIENDMSAIVGYVTATAAAAAAAAAAVQLKWQPTKTSERASPAQTGGFDVRAFFHRRRSDPELQLKILPQRKRTLMRHAELA